MSASRQTAIALPDGVELIRFEKNLLQMGFFSAHDRRSAVDDTVRRMEQWVNRDGKKIRVAAEFRSTLGLPSTSDRDKYMAFMKIAMDQKRLTGKLQNPIRFSGYSMLKALGLSDAGNNYEDLHQWGRRMADTTITSERIIYSASKKTFMDQTVHVFRSFTRTGSSELDDSNQTVQFFVELEDWLLDNLEESYVVPEDFAKYRKLKRATAKGIFPNLSYWFFASGGKEIERDYTDLCSFLNIRRYEHISKIKETMGLSLDELVQIEYLSNWRIEQMKSKAGYKLVLSPGRAILSFLEQNATRHKAHPSLMAPEPIAVALTAEQEAVKATLMSFGVSDEKAIILCTKHELGHLEDHVDYIVSEIMKDDVRRINNPAGLIVSFIDNQKPIPRNYETKSDRERRVKQDKEVAALKEQVQIALANEQITRDRYDVWFRDMAMAEIESKFSKEELDRRLKQIRSERSKDKAVAVMLNRMTPGQVRSCLEPLLQVEIGAELDLPSYETWLETVDRQKSLF